MIQVEHEMHQRRRGRNLGVGLLLVGLIGIVFGLSVVKVTLGHNVEKFDHVRRPMLEQTE
ncbi:hypothetical protein [Actibacterium sp. 188UL27-1]|uniref:hypothetical protein n=1 Tax=Actibacterium sp. 188UL27-1 TaxID=2786961 RepID=UPI00195CDAE1|nr:hypothetical protein [Actibacterium sp. 188UL27-1]MBM7066921.1 hypothetical protein [Actibacterium sp. 188UL27-1]